MNIKELFLSLVAAGVIGMGCTARGSSLDPEPLRIVSSHRLRSQGLSVRFSPDSKYLMIAGSIGTGSLGYYANGETLFDFTHSDTRLRLWNVGKQREIERLKARPIFGQWNGSHMLLMPDFKTLVTSWGALDFKVIDVRKRRPDRKFEVHNGYLSSMALSPDGNVLALGMTREVQFWDAHTFRLLKTYSHGGQATKVRFGSNSRIVKCMWEGMRAQYVDVKTARQVRPGPTLDYEIIFSPDKKHFLRVKDQRHIELWRKGSSGHRKIRTWQVSLAQIEHVQFSPDGKLVAAAGLSSTKNPVEFFRMN